MAGDGGTTVKKIKGIVLAVLLLGCIIPFASGEGVPEWADVSSSAVREIAAFGGDIRPLVPGNVWKDIVRKLSEAGEKK